MFFLRQLSFLGVFFNWGVICITDAAFDDLGNRSIRWFILLVMVTLFIKIFIGELMTKKPGWFDMVVKRH